VTTTTNPPADPELRSRAEALRLPGLLAHWDQARGCDWLPRLLGWEEAERARRSMERRVGRARIGAFKPLVDFDWSWPTKCDRAAIEELMTLEFLAEATNVVLFGPNGVGKSTIAKNLAHQALGHGYNVHFANAGELLGTLAALDSASARNRKLRHYASFDLLAIDEVGYLSYSNRHADLLFELTNRRYQKKSTVLTTNRSFSEWHEVFPNAACVVSLVDRLTHNAEIISVEGQSYRHKEAQERAEQRAQRRRRKKP
jgi:DNA replication protein DnaC